MNRRIDKLYAGKIKDGEWIERTPSKKQIIEKINEIIKVLNGDEDDTDWT